MARIGSAISYWVPSSRALTPAQVINWAIPSRGDVSSAVGAFIIGYAKLPPVSGKAQKRYSTLGHLYSRVFHGTAFIVMFNGIGFLVPGAITATGGYAGNYRGKSEDQYSSSLTLGLRMITGKYKPFFTCLTILT